MSAIQARAAMVRRRHPGLVSVRTITPFARWAARAFTERGLWPKSLPFSDARHDGELVRAVPLDRSLGSVADWWSAEVHHRILSGWEVPARVSTAQQAYQRWRDGRHAETLLQTSAREMRQGLAQCAWCPPAILIVALRMAEQCQVDATDADGMISAVRAGLHGLEPPRSPADLVVVLGAIAAMLEQWPADLDGSALEPLIEEQLAPIAAAQWTEFFQQVERGAMGGSAGRCAIVGGWCCLAADQCAALLRAYSEDAAAADPWLLTGMQCYLAAAPDARHTAEDLPIADHTLGAMVVAYGDETRNAWDAMRPLLVRAMGADAAEAYESDLRNRYDQDQ